MEMRFEKYEVYLSFKQSESQWVFDTLEQAEKYCRAIIKQTKEDFGDDTKLYVFRVKHEFVGSIVGKDDDWLSFF